MSSKKTTNGMSKSEFLTRYVKEPSNPLPHELFCRMINENLTELHNEKDILSFKDPGFFLGLTCNNSDNPQYIGLKQGDDGNIAIIGGCGSGKSSGNIYTTLQTYNGTMLVLDIKKELYSYYLNLLRKGKVSRRAIFFDPDAPNGFSFDFYRYLSTVSESERESLIMELALVIIPEDPDAKEKFWSDSERALVAAALLHFYICGLSFVESICKIFELPLRELCSVLNSSSDKRVIGILGNSAEMKDEMLATIERGIKNKIQWFTDEKMCNALMNRQDSSQTFTWEDTEDSNIFLCIPENKLQQWSGIIKLMLSQLVHYLERRPEKYNSVGVQNIQTLLLLDEFARLGKMDFLASAICTLRSKSVNFCLVLQSIAQLDQCYGEYTRRIIMDNCQYLVILGANDPDTQKYLSDRIGAIPRIRRGCSENYSKHGEFVGFSKQYSENQEPIIPPHMLARLGHAIVVTPNGLHLADKVRGYMIPNIPLIMNSSDIYAIVENILRNKLANESCTNNLERPFMSFNEIIAGADSKLEAYRQQKRNSRIASEKADKQLNYKLGEAIAAMLPTQFIQEESSEINSDRIQAIIAKIQQNKGVIQSALEQCADSK